MKRYGEIRNAKEYNRFVSEAIAFSFVIGLALGIAATLLVT